MSKNQTPENNISFAEQIRQNRIDNLMAATELLDTKTGSYDPSPEAYDERRREFNKFTSPQLHDKIKGVESKLRDIELNEIAERSADMHRKGILKTPERDSSNYR